MSIGAISSGGGYDSMSISQMRQNMFKMWDTDGDGAISQTECQTAADTMSKETGLSITADQMMSIFDLNQDGVITQAEQTQASSTWEDHMKNLMDSAGMSPMGPPPPPPDAASELSDLVDQIFAAVDTNGDGTISKSEYETAMEQLDGQSSSNAASSTTTTGSSTSASSSTTAASTTTDSTSSTDGTGLAALLQQFLDMLAKLQGDQYSQYSQNSENSQSSQNFLGMNSYA
ncbi:MAG: EF-hand domain-containing protein [Desulfobaccales bacterium]